MNDDFLDFDPEDPTSGPGKKFWLALRRDKNYQRIQSNFLVMLESKNWILVDLDDGIEVWSIVDDEIVTELDEELVQRSYDLDGMWIEPDQAITEWVAFQFWMIRRVKKEQLSPNGLNMVKWLDVLLTGARQL
jgi:hypothetical protein